MAINIIDKLVKNSVIMSKSEEEALFLKFWDKENKKYDLEKVSDLLIRANIKYIIYCARKQRFRTKVSLEELVGEGIYGFQRTITKYNNFDVKFMTYASHWIKAAISLYIEQNSFAYPIPHNKAQEIRVEQKKINEARTNGTEYFPDKNLNQIMENCKNCFSLDSKVNGKQESTFNDIIPDKNDDKDLDYELKDRNRYISEVMEEVLNKREIIIIKAFYKFYEKDYTMLEIAKLIKTSPTKVSELRNSALAKLSKYIELENI